MGVKGGERDASKRTFQQLQLFAHKHEHVEMIEHLNNAID